MKKIAFLLVALTALFSYAGMNYFPVDSGSIAATNVYSVSSSGKYSGCFKAVDIGFINSASTVTVSVATFNNAGDPEKVIFRSGPLSSGVQYAPRQYPTDITGTVIGGSNETEEIYLLGDYLLVTISNLNPGAVGRAKVRVGIEE